MQDVMSRCLVMRIHLNANYRALDLPPMKLELVSKPLKKCKSLGVLQATYPSTRSLINSSTTDPTQIGQWCTPGIRSSQEMPTFEIFNRHANHIVMQASCPELRRLIGKNQISMTSQEVWWNRLWCWPYYRSPWGLFWSKVCLEWSQKSEKKSLVKRQSGNKKLLWPHQEQWDGGKGCWQAWIRIQGSCVVTMIETKM